MACMSASLSGNLVGTPGLTVFLGLTAIAFLTYVSAETIFILRKILNPTRFIDKVKFKITNNDPDEKVDSYEQQLATVDDYNTLVFDDPASQTVEFPRRWKGRCDRYGI